ncbi:MAG: hypothetical protein IH957_01885 [Chloroflexi bacterium]|nr:hypothetical protein [Chloroflexota bacterium]
MFELYYSEKLRELEVERLGRLLPHQVSVLEQPPPRARDEATFLGALLTRLKALTIRRVATNVPLDVGNSAKESACSGESATLRSN